jgi:glycosyltransferase involved in cell wall biosynthesis
LKILHIINGLSNGGTEGVLYRLINGDNKNQHFVISLTDLGVYGQKLIENQICVKQINLSKNIMLPKKLLLIYLHVKKIHPDLIQTWMYHSDLVGGIIAKLLRINSIVWGIRNSNLDKSNVPFSTRLIAKINAISSNYIPNQIISCSIEAKKIHHKLGFNEEKITVIPNGYDLNKFRPINKSRVSLRSKLGLTEDVFLMGMVARWHKHKDHQNLFKALNLLNKTSELDWKMIIIGHDINKSNLELISLLKSFNLLDKVIILEQRLDIEVVYSAIDLHILSSLGEAFPNVVAEAMSSETPCISTDVGDASFIIGSTGWLSRPKDFMHLNEVISLAIDEFFFNRSEWNDRKLKCRKRINDKFSLKTMVNNYHDLWNDVHDRQ